MRIFRPLSGIFLVVIVAGCQQASPVPVSTPKPSTGFEAKPHGTLAQLMRGIPFPNSNIIFDTQTRDPAAAAKSAVDRSSTVAAGGATGVYSNVYSGWQQVEN